MENKLDEIMVKRLKDVIDNAKDHECWWYDNPEKGGLDVEVVKAALDFIENTS